MPISGRVAVLPAGENTLEIKEFTFGDPAPYQVTVRQHASGICHSQLHEIHSARSGTRLLGHESTGVVEAVGSGVKHVAVGDTVIVTCLSRAPEVGVRCGVRGDSKGLRSRRQLARIPRLSDDLDCCPRGWKREPPTWARPC
jgi:D-arabinose 1-dehydrogenase-like Zn-dependent alcohol dehydrogenase